MNSDWISLKSFFNLRISLNAELEGSSKRKFNLLLQSIGFSHQNLDIGKQGERNEINDRNSKGTFGYKGYQWT